MSILLPLTQKPISFPVCTFQILCEDLPVCGQPAICRRFRPFPAWMKSPLPPGRHGITVSGAELKYQHTKLCTPYGSPNARTSLCKTCKGNAMFLLPTNLNQCGMQTAEFPQKIQASHPHRPFCHRPPTHIAQPKLSPPLP